MAISTYSELQSATLNWLDRSDSSFTARVPEFITLAEATINRRLRVRQQLTTSVLAPSSGSVTIPTDYLEWKRVTRLAAVSQSLEWAEPGDFSMAYQAQVLLLPNMPAANGLFTIEGDALRVRPVDSSNIQLLYYAKVPALSVTATTNWLLTAHPDAYLAATLAEATFFAEGPDVAMAWAARRDMAFAEIERVSKQSQGQASIRATGPTP